MSPRFLPALFALLSLGTSLSHAGAGEAPTTVCRTFRVNGVECGGCAYLVEYALRETKGITAAQVTQGLESSLSVTFDPRVVGDQRIAQAVRDATPLHGEPYTAQLKLRIRGYARHAATVDALFERWKDSVHKKVLDRENGDLLLSFSPLKPDATQRPATGWTLSQWAEAAKAALPPELVWEVAE